MTHTLTAEQLQDALTLAAVAPKLQAIILENYVRLQMRAELAESQLAYWIEQAANHGHGPDDDVPVGLFDEEVEGD